MGKDIKEITACILLTLACISIYVSCKKETSCENCRSENDKNKPPIANAGLDQVITLPTDSVLLDGRTSSDPDGILTTPKSFSTVAVSAWAAAATLTRTRCHSRFSAGAANF